MAAFGRAADQLAAKLANSDDKPLAALAAELDRQATELHLALYDNGETLYLAPALSSSALEENREPGDDAKPWLSFQAILFGSDDLLRTYPQPELQAVRTGLGRATAAYLDRDSADRPTKFAAAMDRFAAAIRTLGQRIEPLRQKLPLHHRDQTDRRHGLSAPRLDRRGSLLQSARPVLLVVGGEPGGDALSVVGRQAAAKAACFGWAWSCSRCSGAHRGRPGVARLRHGPGAADRHVRDGGLRGAVRGPPGFVVCPAAAVLVGSASRMAAEPDGVVPTAVLAPGEDTAQSLRLPLATWALVPFWLVLLLRLALMVVVFLGLAHWPGRFGLRVFDLLPSPRWERPCLGQRHPGVAGRAVRTVGRRVLPAAGGGDPVGRLSTSSARLATDMAAA